MKFPELDAVEGKIALKNKELHEIFQDAWTPDGALDMDKVKAQGGSSADKAAYIKSLNDELAALGAEADRLRPLGEAAARAKAYNGEPAGEPGDGRPAPEGEKSFGERFVASKAYSGRGEHHEATIDVSLKTLFERSAGWTPESTRSGLVVLDAQRPVQVTDLLPSIPTSQAAYKYMEETTFTNNAVEKAEGASFGEAVLALTERTVTVEKIPVFIPVTDEQLEDEAGAMAYLDQRLPFMVRQRLDSQILVGNGSTPNIRGVNNATNIQTQALGADPVPDAVYKAMTKVKVTGRAMPNAAVFHPNDWQGVRLLRTTDGIYIWGSPSEPGPARIWGLQVVESDAQTENTAVVGDFANYSLLVVRSGIEVKVSDSHSTYFVEGKQAIRATIRAAAVWTRGEAFCTVTGI